MRQVVFRSYRCGRSVVTTTAYSTRPKSAEERDSRHQSQCENNVTRRASSTTGPTQFSHLGLVIMGGRSRRGKKKLAALRSGTATCHFLERQRKNESIHKFISGSLRRIHMRQRRWRITLFICSVWNMTVVGVNALVRMSTTATVSS